MDRFWRYICVIWCISAQRCVFWGFVDMPPRLGSQIPNPPTGAWIGIFKPNSQNKINLHVIETTSWFDFNQILQNDEDRKIIFASGPNTRIKKSKMADGRHFVKSKNRHISATVWPMVMKFGRVSWLLFLRRHYQYSGDELKVKIFLFQQSYPDFVIWLCIWRRSGPWTDFS